MADDEEEALLATEVPRGGWLAAVAQWGGTLLVCGVLLVVAGRVRAPALDGRAPDFALTALDGTSYTRDALQGRTVVLNFWATWCGPCRMEMPLLSRWARAHPDVVLIGVAVDEQPGPVRAFLRERELPYPVALDDAGMQADYGVTTLPTTVVIGPDGRIAGAHTGILFGPELDLLLP